MRRRNFFLVLLTLSAVVGIALIYPQSQWSELIDIKKAAAQSACQNRQGETPSEEKIMLKDRPLVNIATYLAAVGQNDQALKVVDMMKICGFRDIALGEIVSSLAKRGQIDQAMQLFNSIRRNDEKGMALAKVAENLVSVGQFDRALQLASTSKSYRNNADALHSIVRSLAQAGQYDRAKKVASTMNEGPQKDMAFVDIAASLAEVGKIAEAVQIVSRIKERTPLPERWFSDTVMVLAHQRKKYEPALQIANAIRDENEKAFTLAWLANELVKVGQTELASQAIKPALEIVGFEPIVRP